jgi:hypothetical protein
MAKESKYRPYLTRDQINYLYDFLRTGQKDVTRIDIHLELEQDFKLLAFKVNEGISTPSYQTTVKVDIETAIGITLEEKRLAAYEKYNLAELRELKLVDHLTQQEIAYAELYMYEHDLMRTDEEAYYETNGTLIGYIQDENSSTNLHS